MDRTGGTEEGYATRVPGESFRTRVTSLSLSFPSPCHAFAL